MSSAHGPIISRADFLDAIRLRLGADIVAADTKCIRCGATMTKCASHAFCCALPEATRGHYSVRDAVLPLAHLADPRTSVEPRGLVPSAQALRPADILSSAALPGRLTALDIGIASPDASGAGDDCCDAMFQRKRYTYRNYLHELENEREILYRPLVWSTWGREHPETTSILQSLSRVAARRCGLRDHRLLLRRVRSAVSVEIMRRAVRMLHACLPHERDAQNRFLLGDSIDASEYPKTREIVLHSSGADACS